MKQLWRAGPASLPVICIPVLNKAAGRERQQVHPPAGKFSGEIGLGLLAESFCLSPPQRVKGPLERAAREIKTRRRPRPSPAAAEEIQKIGPKQEIHRHA